MHRRANHDDALKTPASRVFLRRGEEQIISLSIGLRYPIDVEALKEAFSNSIIIEHLRFRSLMVRDRNGEHWKRTLVNIDDHFIINHINPDDQPTTKGLVEDDHQHEAALNNYLADLAVSCPLSEDKPLWEVHVLTGLNCVVLRVHHAIGDGASLMSMLSACFGKKRDEGSNERERHHGRKATHEKRSWKHKGLGDFVLTTIWLTLVFFVRFVGRLLWVKDQKSMISGGDGVEFWPQKVVTAKFKLEDFKSIKTVIPSVTINDVLMGIIESGLSKYMYIKSPTGMLQGLQLTAIIAVNLRGKNFQDMLELALTRNGSSPLWGNKIGMIFLPLRCRGGMHPLDHVTQIKTIMDRKKQSYETQLIDVLTHFVTCFLGIKVTGWLGDRLLYNTSLLVSNITGPSRELTIANNPVTYLRVNVCSSPHAIQMHMVSYKGNVDMQIMVAKDILPDPEFLRDCFKESFLEMMGDSQQGKIDIVEE